MVKGMRSYSSKERRKVRRANHAARDLRTPKYRQRIVEPKIHKDPKYKHKDFEYDSDEE